MSIEQTLDQILTLVEGITITLQDLAKAPAATPAAVPAKKGPGRPPKAVEAVAVHKHPDAPAVLPDLPGETVDEAFAADAAKAVDPFAQAATVQPTKEEVRAAAIALSGATTQENAVAVMKAATGASSFGELEPDLHAKAIAAFTAAMPKVSVDPFAVGATATPTAAKETAAPTAAVQGDGPSLTDVRDAVIDAQKRTGVAQVQGVVMLHGGVLINPATGVKGPSLNAIPVPAYAAVIAQLKALTTTK